MIRDKALSILGMNTPLWASELLSLKVGDVLDFEPQIDNKQIKKKITVRPDTAKFHEEHTVSIEDDIQQIIKEFIDWKSQNDESIESDAPLFASQNGNRMNITELYEIITRLFGNK